MKKPLLFLVLLALAQGGAAQARVLGVCPALLTAGVLLAGLRRGPETGALLGLLAGVFRQWLDGGPQSWAMVLLALLGGLWGEVPWFGRSFFGEWLGVLAGLLLWESLQGLGALLSGQGTFWAVAVPELWWTAAWFPLVWLLGKPLLSPERRERHGTP